MMVIGVHDNANALNKPSLESHLAPHTDSEVNVDYSRTTARIQPIPFSQSHCNNLSHF
jgi:hypothetical protein